MSNVIIPTKPRNWKNTQGLPLPRLELWWEKTFDEDKNWVKKNCWYGLVLPVGKTDIRNNDEGAVFVVMGCTMVSGGAGNKYNEDSEYYGCPKEEILGKGTKVDIPFRDGAHAKWDSNVLELQVWVVCDDGYSKVEDRSEYV